MRRFRFKYSPIVWMLLLLVIAFSVGGLVMNIFNVIEYASFGSDKVITYSIVLSFNALLTIFALSVLFYGFYVIKDDRIYACFGFVRSKYLIKDIVEFAHFKKSDKLVAYFKDGKYTVIVIDKNHYDEFIAEVRKINPEILFENRIEGEDLP